MTLFLKLLFVLFIFIFLLPFSIHAINTDSVNINLEITGTCNTNSICEPSLGETQGSCPNDCGCNNNLLCESTRNETEENCPTDCITANNTPTIGGSYSAFNIENIVVENITINSANILWLTSYPAICQFFWGKTQEYEKEIISETNLKFNHFIELKNLDFSSKYNFKISCINERYNKSQTQNQEIKTKTPLNNVINFTAVSGNEKINLSWVNPPDINFSKVKILRKNNFFPLNINDGIVVYEGSENYFEDLNLINGKIYYYTIFLIDNNKNYSSGAITFATPYKTNEASIKPVLPITPEIPPDDTEGPSVSSERVTIDDFIFYTDGINIPVKNNIIEVFKNASLNISIDCLKIFDIKTVLVNLQNKEKLYSFILKPEGEKKICNVSFIVPKNYGNYPLEILIINNDNEVSQKIDLKLKVLSKNKLEEFLKVINYKIYILTTLIIIFFIILLFIIKKRKLIR